MHINSTLFALFALTIADNVDALGIAHALEASKAAGRQSTASRVERNSQGEARESEGKTS